MDAIVYIEAWQLQCCGEPFRVGDSIEWNCSDSVDRESLATLLGAARAEVVTHVEDHHDVAGPTFPLAGRVTGIAAVVCTTEIQGDVRVPVSGGAKINDISSADGWESEPRGRSATEGSDEDPHFYGYLVHLEAATSGSR